MAPQMTNLLILDDESDIRMEIKEFLSSFGYNVFLAARPHEAFKIVANHPIDIAVLDIRLPEMNGLEVLKEIRRMRPDTKTIMMSGFGDMDAAITALRLGAVDFFQKPFLLNELHQTIEKVDKTLALSKAHQAEHVTHPGNKKKGSDLSFSFIAVSAAMKKVMEKMNQVARAKDTTVLITGESGTGKELVARGIHYFSDRKDKPFHAVNCSSIPDELFESEFFGYKRGAFTGAVTDKPGWFESADGGTLFLDEIGDLKLSLQSKLLRIMEDKEVYRLGSTIGKKVDVRVIAATNQDLEQLIMEKQFRADLYYRINSFILNIPALRDRKEGIPKLFAYYLEYCAHKLEKPIPEVDKSIMAALMNYDFPGNVRELKHMIEKAIIICDGDKLTLEHFYPLELKLQKANVKVKKENHFDSLDNIERSSIERILRDVRYNKSQAARLLKISRQSLDRRLIKLGITVK
jgi:DNA-binding NtrC family response regulator